MNRQNPFPPATFLEDIYKYLERQIQERFVMIGLLGSLYGVLTLVSLLSIYGLLRRACRKDPTTIVLCLALLGLFASTTIHVITNILFHLSNILAEIITSKSSLWSYGGYVEWAGFPTEVVKDYARAQPCVSTAALTINITLGDAIVCWRARFVWHKRRAVMVACSALVCATFALGVAATALSCDARQGGVYSQCAVMFATGVMYERFPAGVAACALSLVTNVFATGLVGESRTRLRGYLVAGPRTAQVEKLFALLVESGAVYSALWVVIVAFQVSQYGPPGPLSAPAINSFLDIFGVLVNGALVPAIAIYPALIVVLVALDRTHIEKAFVDGLKDRCALDALTFQLDRIALEANLNPTCSPAGGIEPFPPPEGLLIGVLGRIGRDSCESAGGTITCGSERRRMEMEGMV